MRQTNKTTNDMKRNYIFTTMLLAICTLQIPQMQAQTVKENELAIVYYMPLTQVAITIEYDEITMRPGPFYLYAERYLGSKDVITEAQTRYQLTGITTSTRTVPDTNRAYKVVAQKGVEAQLLALTKDGILYGYNVPPEAPVPYPYRPLMAREMVSPKLMPLLEEQMVANSTAKMAEGAAKQIYHLRETRLNILAGDVEHAPADGQAMQLVMNELDQREQQLSALFVGSKTIQHRTETIYYTPTAEREEEVVCRLSQFAGIVPADDLSGEPIRLTFSAHRQTLAPESEATNGKKNALPSQIYYNLPGSIDLQVEYADKVQVSSSYPVAQYGVAIPLALDLFTAKTMPHIYFNTQTGNISSIQK